MQNLSDQELFDLYYKANNILEGKHPSISTAKIYIAMKAAYEEGYKKAFADAMLICNNNALPTLNDDSNHTLGFEAGSAVCRDEIENLLNKVRNT